MEEINYQKALKDLEASEKRYRRLFETAQDGVLIIDFNTGIILDVNPFLVDMLGYSKDDLLKKYLWDVGFLRDVVASKENFMALQTEKLVRFEDLPLETKDGKRKDVEFVANAYQVNGDHVIQCNIRDITARKKAESQLKEKMEELEKMNQAMIGRELEMVKLKEKIKEYENKK
ncbi:MAG: PAS domain S-box protein [Candidatus Magasanikbacteria bacterium]|jgi:PAS domain S-box-containing protein